MFDAAEQIAHAREHLGTQGQGQIAAILGCEPGHLDAALDTVAARSKARALKIRITGGVRDRARNGRYAYVHDRGQDFAAGVWVVDPAFMLDLVHEHIGEGDTTPALECWWTNPSVGLRAVGRRLAAASHATLAG
jgi:hypothetical protein